MVKAPTEFTVSSKWKPFKEGVVVFFNYHKGRRQISLAYTIGDDNATDPNTIHDTGYCCYTLTRNQN